MDDLLSRDWGLKPLHEKMLKMIEYIHQFCKKYSINYCLAYGSALGAKRHGGFIPWDDDVDIYMDVDGYKKFREVFEKKGDHANYYLQELGKTDDLINFSKIRMNGTTFIEPLTKQFDMHHGIYIDIFVLHNCTGNGRDVRKMKIAGEYLALKRISNLYYNRRKLYRPLLSFLRLFPYDFGRKKALEIISKYDEQDTDFFYESDYKANRAFYKKNMIFPAKEMDFEGTKVCVPRRIEEYLTILYGDYMKFPSLESVLWMQHSGEWYVDKDFREVVDSVENFKDEVLG